MFKLPDFFDQLDSHQQQMLAAHAAMYEDICSVVGGHMGEYFREPKRRNTSFYAEGLAWAVQSMASEAAERMEHAVYSDFLYQEKHPEPAKTAKEGWKLGFFEGLNSGNLEATYKVIRSGYQALRSHGMKAKTRSAHWDLVGDHLRSLYWDVNRFELPAEEE